MWWTYSTLHLNLFSSSVFHPYKTYIDVRQTVGSNTNGQSIDTCNIDTERRQIKHNTQDRKLKR
jgi:hypothetical protein